MVSTVLWPLILFSWHQYYTPHMHCPWKDIYKIKSTVTYKTNLYSKIKRLPSKQPLLLQYSTQTTKNKKNPSRKTLYGGLTYVIKCLSSLKSELSSKKKEAHFYIKICFLIWWWWGGPRTKYSLYYWWNNGIAKIICTQTTKKHVWMFRRYDYWNSKKVIKK